jgi:hypothetical protein
MTIIENTMFLLIELYSHNYSKKKKKQDCSKQAEREVPMTRLISVVVLES